MASTTTEQPPKSSIIVAAVEGGGTSFVVAVARSSLSTSFSSSSTETVTQPEILHREEIDSSHDNPSKTLEECAKFFQKHKPNDCYGYDALGVATFGPVGLNKSNMKTYGHILSTSPKKSWRNVDILTPLIAACQGSNRNSKPLAVDIETDVNAPALAEYMLAKQQEQQNANKDSDEKKNISSVAYVTVGTGIGVGLVVNGQPVHGRMHPEGGHVHVQQLENDPFKGYSWGDKCPYRGIGTVEGIASSVALTERLQADFLKMKHSSNDNDDASTSTTKIQQQSDIVSRGCLVDLDDDHEVWDHAANAIANLCTTLLLTVSIEKIVLGGGIMKRNGLLRKVQSRTLDIVNGYIELPPIDTMSSLIATSSYGITNSGLIGSIIVAQNAYEKQHTQIESRTNSDTSDGRLSPFISGFIHGVVVSAMGLGIGLMTITGRPSARR